MSDVNDICVKTKTKLVVKMIKLSKLIRICVVLGCISVIVVISLSPWTWSESCEEIRNYLPLVDSTITPNGRNNIFFIESTQPCNEMLELNVRQACSIESAARQNPNWNIFLYVVGAKGYQPTPQNIRLWKILESFKNIHIKTINDKNFTKNTPLEKLFETGLNSFSFYLKYHRSDLLRYTILWKYAGTYLDLDVISQKPINTLGYNFAVEQEKNYETLIAGAGAINFDSDDVGREISYIVIEDLAKNFNGHKWDDSSVRVLTRAITQICGSNFMWEINAKRCKGFKVFPVETFYAVSYSERNFLMDPKYEQLAMEMVQNSVGVHAWNKVTANQRLKKTSNAALVQLAKKFCPLTFESIEEYY